MDAVDVVGVIVADDFATATPDTRELRLRTCCAGK